MGEDFDNVIDTYYLPIALWLEKQVRLGKADPKSKGAAVCVGLSIP